MSPFIHETRGVGWAKYLWLAYLLFYFAYLVLLPATMTAWLLAVLALVALPPPSLGGFEVTGASPAALPVRVQGRRHAPRNRLACHLRDWRADDAGQPRCQLRFHLCRGVH